VPGSSGGTTLPGLSTDCTAAVNAQVGVADIFGRAVDGTKLTAKDVSTVFDAIAADTPGGLAGELATLRDAAERSVGKSDVAVAEILQEKKITAARDALSEYVLKCSPPTS
jgi:uridylate kinase